MGHGEIGCGGMDLFVLAQNRGKWKAFVKVENKHQFVKKASAPWSGFGENWSKQLIEVHADNWNSR